MKLFKTLGLAAVVAGSLSVAAYAAGYFPDFPVLGSASFCASTNSQSPSTTIPGTLPSGSVCTNTVPAGPTSVTGSETVLAQTNLPNGVAPQNINVPIGALGGGSIVLQTTGATSVMVAGERYLALNGVGTTEAVTLPPNPVDNQLVTVANLSATAITTFSVAAASSPSGTTLVGVAPTNLGAQTVNSAAAATSTVDYVYQASSNSWLRIQ